MIYQQAAAATGSPFQGTTWWLDVEGAQCNDWDSSKPTINLAVIQGAVDYLHSQGVTAGIYTDSYDWNRITASNTTQFAASRLERRPLQPIRRPVRDHSQQQFADAV